jgi:hypothetical protein
VERQAGAERRQKKEHHTGYDWDVCWIIMKLNAGSRLSVGIVVAIEERTARLTILIDPRKKGVFERLCAEEDATPSQVVRRLIRRYIEERTGRAWMPPAAESARRLPAGGRRKNARRRADATHRK